MVIVVWVTLASSIFSLIGSVTSICVVIRSERKLSTVYHRLIFCISCLSLAFSIGCMFTTLPSPKGTESDFVSIGTTWTCVIQGLIVFIGGAGTCLYNGMISIFYVLTIAYNISDEVMASKVEPFFHLIPCFYLLLSGIFITVQQAFNPAGVLCMISSHPRNCSAEPDTDCIRGENAKRVMFLFTGPIILMAVLITVCMVVIIRTVNKQEETMESYRMSSITLPGNIQSMRRESFTGRSGQGSFSRSRNQKVAFTQCTLYVTVFYLAWVPGIVYNIVSIRIGHRFESMIVFTAFFVPLQGFFNCAIFLRPKIAAILRLSPELSLHQAVWKTVTTRDMSAATIRRRRSLLDRQQNGGSRYTAREWHLHEVEEQKEKNDTETCNTETYKEADGCDTSGLQHFVEVKHQKCTLFREPVSFEHNGGERKTEKGYLETKEPDG